MRSRYRVGQPFQTHFITSTIVEWLPVFTTAASCDILVEAFAHYQARQQWSVYAWVILDNHFHAIVGAADLARTVAGFKSFTARRLLAQVDADGRGWLRDQWHFYRARHKTGSDHQVWQEGFHPQELSSDEAMLQKIDYVHYNPVARGLVSAPEHWRYSSAHEWLPGARPVLRCDAWR